MNCAEKLLEPTIFFNLYTKSPYKSGSGTITMFYMKDLNKPVILIPVSSKSVEKLRSCRRLNICKWTVMEEAIL